jgi:hypothetical protein
MRIIVAAVVAIQTKRRWVKTYKIKKRVSNSTNG